MDAPTLIALLGVTSGIGTLIFVGLRFNREDAGQAVETQSKVLASMRDLIDELEEALQRCRDERKRLEEKLRKLTRGNI